MLDIHVALAAHGVPIEVYSMTIAGATSPVTLAGTVVQGLAEFLGVATAMQVAAPGAKLVFCFGSGVLDMLRTTFSLGCVESALMGAMATEVGHYLGVPTLNPGLSTDSKHPGLQTGYEKALKVATVCGANPDIVSGWGLIDSHNTMYLPQSVIDNEIAAMARRLQRRVEVSAATMAGESIAKVGPGGGYLGEKDTARRIRAGEHLMPPSRTDSPTTSGSKKADRERRGEPRGRAHPRGPRRQGAQPERCADRRSGRTSAGWTPRASAARAAVSAAPAPTQRSGESMTMRIGFIGLGCLGRHLAGSLLRAGFPVTVFDIDSELLRRLGRSGRHLRRLGRGGGACLRRRHHLPALARGGRQPWSPASAASSRGSPPAAPGST